MRPTLWAGVLPPPSRSRARSWPRIYNNSDPFACLRPLAEAWLTEVHWCGGQSFAHLAGDCPGCDRGLDLAPGGYAPALLHIRRRTDGSHDWRPVTWFLPDTMLLDPAIADGLCGRVFEVERSEKVHLPHAVRACRLDYPGPVARDLLRSGWFDAKLRMAAMWKVNPDELITIGADADDSPADEAPPTILRFSTHAPAAAEPTPRIEKLVDHFPKLAARLAQKGGA